MPVSSQVLIVLAALLALLVLWRTFGRVTVFDYQHGLRFRAGRFRDVLGPGIYWHLRPRTKIDLIEARPRVVTVPGQEVLSQDNVALKVSLLLRYRVADAKVAVLESEDFDQALYAQAQVALREAVGSTPMDQLLASRAELSARLLERVRPRADELGVELSDLAIKDIMLPGALKEVFAQTARARQEGLASLERARGETAALRSLANAAKMLEDNPKIYQLRLLQSIGEAKAGSLVIHLDFQRDEGAVEPTGDDGSRES